MDRILANLKESRALAAERDALLPGLVSGELWAGNSSVTLQEVVR